MRLIESVSVALVGSTMAAALVMSSSGCGASIQAIYEGDVRFERCMARDAQPSVTATERKACWVEWVSFYTYGQTKDRVLHAQLRLRQLEGAADVRKSSATEPEEPTHPLLAKTGDAERRRRQSCTAECHTVNEGCLTSCSDAGTCGPSCAVGLRQCQAACD